MFEKLLLKRWIKELKANIDGMRKMSRDYRERGGFREVAETLAKFNAEGLIPKELLDQGRGAELQFADATQKLADCYERLLVYVEKLAYSQVG